MNEPPQLTPALISVQRETVISFWCESLLAFDHKMLPADGNIVDCQFNHVLLVLSLAVYSIEYIQNNK